MKHGAIAILSQVQAGGERTIAAPPETVFDVIAEPYLARTPRAIQDKLRVLERGTDMVLAAHFTTVGRLTTKTVETVRFERPNRVSFRLVTGPVPHVLETYTLNPTPEGTAFTYAGEIGADLWQLGKWWADRVARPWEQAVTDSRSTPKPSDALARDDATGILKPKLDRMPALRGSRYCCRAAAWSRICRRRLFRG